MRSTGSLGGGADVGLFLIISALSDVAYLHRCEGQVQVPYIYICIYIHKHVYIYIYIYICIYIHELLLAHHLSPSSLIYFAPA
jgi:hypothetical protein